MMRYLLAAAATCLVVVAVLVYDRGYLSASFILAAVWFWVTSQRRTQ